MESQAPPPRTASRQDDEAGVVQEALARPRAAEMATSDEKTRMILKRGLVHKQRQTNRQDIFRRFAVGSMRPS